MSNAPELSARVPEWDLGDRLYKARRIAGLTKVQMADYLEMSHSVISKYEYGGSEPRLPTIKRWALRTGVSVEWLLLGEDATPQPPRGGGAENEGDVSSTKCYVLPRLVAVAA